MRSVVVVDIHLPREAVATLYFDPRNLVKWMQDVERYEPLSGEIGAPGSVYRLIPRQGAMAFTVTVIARQFPHELRFRIDGATASIEAHATLSTSPGGVTRLQLDQRFRFKGRLGEMLGLLAKPAIRRAQRRHVQGFQEFAERHAAVN